jgi:hypothetical protein
MGTYVPRSNAREHTFANGDVITKISFHVEELVEFARAKANSRGWLNLDICRRRTPSEYGDTHYIVLDTWLPSDGKKSAKDRTTGASTTELTEDDIPF